MLFIFIISFTYFNQVRKGIFMENVIDSVGRTVSYEFPPKRIVSLCPGITKTLYALGLDKEIVGRTRCCIYPKESVEQATIVGGTKQVEVGRIVELKPDLIFVEKEENNKEIVETLEKQFPVYVHEVQSVEDAFQMIHQLGQLCHRKSQAQQLVASIQDQFHTLPNVGNKRAAYVIWQRPYMVVGKDTYIQSLLEKMGFINPFTNFPDRYPTVTEEDLRNANLDFVFLASEPYPFTEHHQNQFQQMFPGSRTVIIDGEMCWYGAKMLQATSYFKRIFAESLMG